MTRERSSTSSRPVAVVIARSLCIVTRRARWPRRSGWSSTMFCARRRSTSCSTPQFIGAIQVLVYAGAIMVLFLFVIMLLNLGHAATDMRGRRAATRS